MITDSDDLSRSAGRAAGCPRSGLLALRRTTVHPAAAGVAPRRGPPAQRLPLDLAVRRAGGRPRGRPRRADRAQLPTRVRERPAPARRTHLHRLPRHPAGPARDQARLLPGLAPPDRPDDDRAGRPPPDLGRRRRPATSPSRRSWPTCSPRPVSPTTGLQCARPGCPIQESPRHPVPTSSSSVDSTRPRASTGLLDAWSRAGPERRLVIAGDGPLGDRVRTAVEGGGAGAGLAGPGRPGDGRGGVRRSPVALLRGLSARCGRVVRPRTAGADGLGWQRRHDRRRRHRLGGRPDCRGRVRRDPEPSPTTTS